MRRKKNKSSEQMYSITLYICSISSLQKKKKRETQRLHDKYMLGFPTTDNTQTYTLPVISHQFLPVNRRRSRHLWLHQRYLPRQRVRVPLMPLPPAGEREVEKIYGPASHLLKIGCNYYSETKWVLKTVAHVTKM